MFLIPATLTDQDFICCLEVFLFNQTLVVKFCTFPSFHKSAHWVCLSPRLKWFDRRGSNVFPIWYFVVQRQAQNELFVIFAEKVLSVSTWFTENKLISCWNNCGSVKMHPLNRRHFWNHKWFGKYSVVNSLIGLHSSAT